MNGPPIRFGILGAGVVARVFASDLAAVDGAVLTAVASRTLEGTSAFAADHVGVQAYPSAAEMLSSGDIDVLYVCTPPQRHVEDCLQSLDAGIPVLCEKPFAADAAAAQQVVDRARQVGVFCMEAMWMRFLPAVRAVADMVAAGDVGDPRLLIADFGTAEAFDPAHRLFDPTQGGGALLDRGVYTVALAVMLFGVPDAITSARATVASGVDGDSSLLLHFADERLAVLSSSLTSLTSNTAAVSGTHGRLQLNAPFHRSERMTISRYAPYVPGLPGEDFGPSRKDSVLGRLKRGPLGRPLSWAKGSAVGRPLIAAVKSIVYPSGDVIVEHPITGVGYGYEAAEVVRCLRSGELESPLMPLDETLLVMRIMDEAQTTWAEPRPR